MRQVGLAALMALLLIGSGLAARVACAAEAAGEAGAASAPVGPIHRNLRLPLPEMDALPAPPVPEVFSGYPGAPPYTVVSRKGDLPLYPCSMCHNLRKTNTKVRQFIVAPPPDGAPHAGVLRHGKGRFWCLDCHLGGDREFLRSLDGAKLDFDDTSRLCGQCHSARYRDWVFGGHGKRVAGWTGERQLYGCTACHDPHSPLIPPRAPSPPPPVRAGLQAMDGTPARAPPPGLRVPRGTPDVGPTRP
jgi:hypothetical protein